jgi:hypothetical protein
MLYSRAFASGNEYNELLWWKMKKTKFEILNKLLEDKNNRLLSLLFGMFFFIIPTKAFVGVSSDIVVVYSVLIPVFAALMIMMLSIDHTFELKGMDAEGVGKVFKENSNLLAFLFYYFLTSIFVVIFVKSICLSFDGLHSDLIWLLLHFLCLVVGLIIASTLTLSKYILFLYEYLSTGKELGLLVKLSRNFIRTAARAPNKSSED